jgi:hypothetical protein
MRDFGEKLELNITGEDTCLLTDFTIACCLLSVYLGCTAALPGSPVPYHSRPSRCIGEEVPHPDYHD